MTDRLPLYGRSLALLTDLYQLTMAAAGWEHGRSELDAVFHLTYRSNPFGGGYAIACGLGTLVSFLEDFRFEPDDLAYLATLRGRDDTPLFPPGFLDHLADFRITGDIDAVPEGTVVFPHEPLVRVRGPIAMGQILETPILNIINFQTLLATKAARICQAASGESVLEFGLRRAQGIDGAVTASRAAYIGGCTHTSNVLAGKLHGIPVAGTHAHSWVMSFDDEEDAFEAYAAAMPHNCVLLVDTFDSLEGVRRAVRIGHRLAEHGHRLAGVRLDSGDLAYLSIEARRILDDAGLHDAAIVASNDLDEHVISSLKQQGAAIGIWGVGTRLATAFDQPAFGGVYKLGAIADSADGGWQDRIKLSEHSSKVSVPGILQAHRCFRGDEPVADIISDERATALDDTSVRTRTIIDPVDPIRRRPLDDVTRIEPLLQPVLRGGERVAEIPSASEARQRTQAQLAMFHPGVRRFVNPHGFPVGLDAPLHERRTELVLAARARNRPAPGDRERDRREHGDAGAST